MVINSRLIVCKASWESSILCQIHAKSESLLSSFSTIQIISKMSISYSSQTRVANKLNIVSNIHELQISSLSPLSYLYDDCHKQAVLISESHGDSNRCTPCKGKPDQHVTHIPRLIHVWSWTIHLQWFA
jgi:hypothetical protein